MEDDIASSCMIYLFSHSLMLSLIVIIRSSTVDRTTEPKNIYAKVCEIVFPHAICIIYRLVHVRLGMHPLPLLPH